MLTPDLINGIFEFVGSIVVFFNCFKLHKDKEVKGFVWELAIFYAAWAMWNMYYYPHLHQRISFWGGWLVIIADFIWIGQVIYYRRKKKSLIVP